MSAPSSIEWTERTWNPIVGCSVVSPGCTNCYAMRMAERLSAMAPQANGIGNPHVLHYVGTTTRDPNGRGYDWMDHPVWTGKLALAPESVLLAPLRRRKPTTWFVNSMGDLFHENVPDAWIDRVFAVMALSPQHTFQVLTKRSARMRAYMTNLGQSIGDLKTFLDSPIAHATRRVSRLNGDDLPGNAPLEWWDNSAHAAANPGILRRTAGFPPRNVWLGVSAEDQRRADERVPDLLAMPAAVRFVSAEPLLGSIHFFGRSVDGRHKWDWLKGEDAVMHSDGPDFDYGPGLDWIIVGGESGPGARPMHPDWARSIRDQCAAAGVPFFFKQWGAWKDGSDFAADAMTVLTDGRVLPFDKAELERADRDEPVMRANPTLMRRVGKKAAGRMLDGALHNAMPGRAP